MNNEFLKSKLFTKENEKNLFRSNLIFDSISQGKIDKNQFKSAIIDKYKTQFC